MRMTLAGQQHAETPGSWGLPGPWRARPAEQGARGPGGRAWCMVYAAGQTCPGQSSPAPAGGPWPAWPGTLMSAGKPIRAPLVAPADVPFERGGCAAACPDACAGGAEGEPPALPPQVLPCAGGGDELLSQELPCGGELLSHELPRLRTGKPLHVSLGCSATACGQSAPGTTVRSFPHLHGRSYVSAGVSLPRSVAQGRTHSCAHTLSSSALASFQCNGRHECQQ